MATNTGYGSRCKQCIVAGNVNCLGRRIGPGGIVTCTNCMKFRDEFGNLQPRVCEPDDGTLPANLQQPMQPPNFQAMPYASAQPATMMPPPPPPPQQQHQTPNSPPQSAFGYPPWPPSPHQHYAAQAAQAVQPGQQTVHSWLSYGAEINLTVQHAPLLPGTVATGQESDLESIPLRELGTMCEVLHSNDDLVSRSDGKTFRGKVLKRYYKERLSRSSASERRPVQPRQPVGRLLQESMLFTGPNGEILTGTWADLSAMPYKMVVELCESVQSDDQVLRAKNGNTYRGSDLRLYLPYRRGSELSDAWSNQFVDNE